MPSSVIDSFTYNVSSATLRITFISGAVYDYIKVPQKEYKALAAAASKGTYFNGYIKNNYSFKKVK